MCKSLNSFNELFSLIDAMQDVDEVYHCAGMVSFDPNDGAVKISLNVTNNLVQALITGVNAKLDTVGGLNTGY